MIRYLHIANLAIIRDATLDLGPGDFVAVCMERSAATVAALLAVLKCGAAYVPVEPSWPLERIATILSTVKATCVITERAQLEPLSVLGDQVASLAAVVCVDGVDGVAGVEGASAAPPRRVCVSRPSP